MSHRFRAEDGYTVHDLVHYAVDHLASAGILFASGPRHLDSAGYLSHLSVELLLKAALLERQGGFEATHDLNSLLADLQRLGMHIDLSRASREVVRRINTFRWLRYPDPEPSVAREIGTTDREEIAVLVNELAEQLPKIDEAFREIDPSRKGGRVLMVKDESLGDSKPEPDG